MTYVKSLYFWIVIALVLGVIFGLLDPEHARAFEPFGTNFIKLIKAFIGPIVFLTVATGIAQTRSLKSLGRISLTAIIYFEIVSTIALLIGWGAAALIKPGQIMHNNPTLLNEAMTIPLTQQSDKLSLSGFFQNLIPMNLLEPFIKGDLLQILLLAILFGVSLLSLGESRSKILIDILDRLNQTIFQMIRITMYLAPIGVFGAISYSVAKFGSDFLIPMLLLISTFYLAGAIFVFIILGLIARLSGFSLLRFLKFMSPELLLVLGTASSETALPQLMRKLELLGCKNETVGVVVPLGYSFNLDGTNIYITLATLFIAQALGIDLTLPQQLVIFGITMLTGKGAAGVTGSGFIMLAATLSIVPTIPAIGVVLILGIDRFMSEARSLINFIGNGVATLVISRWQKEVSATKLNHALNTIIDFEMTK